MGKRLFAPPARSRLHAATFCRYRAYMSIREGAMPLAVTLDDKYLLESGRVYLTGTQALVRLPMIQRHRDLPAGLNTACSISGYPAPPPPRLHHPLSQPNRFLTKHHTA